MQPTFETEGVKTYTCTVCGEVMEEAVPVLIPTIEEEQEPVEPEEEEVPERSIEEKKSFSKTDKIFIAIAICACAGLVTTFAVIGAKASRKNSRGRR